MTYAQALDAARFLMEEGWLPAYYAARLSAWLEYADAPARLDPVIDRLDTMQFGTNAGNKGLYRWVNEDSPLKGMP